MSFRARIERIDADYFIPRPADEPDLDSFHAATRFLTDVSRSGTLILSSAIAGYLLFRSGQILNLEFKWMTFVVMGAVFVSFIGLLESISLAYPYYSINQRLTHGSARWASIADLKANTDLRTTIFGLIAYEKNPGVMTAISSARAAADVATDYASFNNSDWIKTTATVANVGSDIPANADPFTVANNLRATALNAAKETAAIAPESAFRRLGI